MIKALEFSKHKKWTLFLDRDGVINQRPINDYVKRVEDFIFIEGATEAICDFQHFFNRIFIVTNQQGVGMGRMSLQDLHTIHQHMLDMINRAGGKIDRIYACTDLHTKPLNCRKPGTQMAFQAKDEFPETDFGKAVMVGDTVSDMQFGKALGMYCVFIGTEAFPIEADAHFPSLKAFADFLINTQQAT